MLASFAVGLIIFSKEKAAVKAVHLVTLVMTGFRIGGFPFRARMYFRDWGESALGFNRDYAAIFAGH